MKVLAAVTMMAVLVGCGVTFLGEIVIKVSVSSTSSKGWDGARQVTWGVLSQVVLESRRLKSEVG